MPMFSLRQLSPEYARLCLSIRDLCLEKFKTGKGRKFCLAVSGGADSTALAIIFQILSPMLDSELMAAHVDHSLRPESGEDALFTLGLCASLHIPCVLEKIDTEALARENSCGLEEAGRIGRYAIFNKIKEKMGADFIVLGHHAGDLAEDIILRLIRGAGWPALGGMSDREGFYLRPLLSVSPKKLRGLLTSLGQSWREDASNESLEFRRNRIRHIIMPLLEVENPGISRSLLRLHQMAELDADYWETQLAAALAKNPWRVEDDGSALLLPRELLADLSPAARLRLYRMAFKLVTANSVESGQIRADTFFSLEETYAKGPGGKCFQLPGAVEIFLKGGAIRFIHKRFHNDHAAQADSGASG